MAHAFVSLLRQLNMKLERQQKSVADTEAQIKELEALAVKQK